MVGRNLLSYLLALLLALCSPAIHAGQDSDNNTAGGLNVSQGLRHRVVIPQIIYFRIGSETFGNVDKVRFDVDPGAGTGNNQSYSGPLAAPIGDGTGITATGPGSLQVEVQSNVGSVNISYDLSDSQGLADGAGNYIPFDEILVVSGDPGGLPTPLLSNAGGSGAASVPVTGNLYGGRVIRRQTTWTYTYANSTPVRAGTYQGTVRYTVSAP